MESTILKDNNEIQNIEQEKVYLIDPYKTSLEDCKILKIDVDSKDPNSLLILTDKTICHPQGGGQPSDEGFFEKEWYERIAITSLSYDREKDLVFHKVANNQKSKQTLIEGDLIKMTINEEKRLFYARLHSGGHLLDIAITQMKLPLVPGKGYHFPDGPYVEYNGKIEKNDIPTLTEKIEKISNELIENCEIENKSIVKIYSYEEGKKIFDLPKYLPENKPFRWVKLTNDDIGCPCGGTHVKHIKDIKGLKINKITNKGKVVRISYLLL
jgi:Ser-tRNA(Ala) deacylase AlaX